MKKDKKNGTGDLPGFSLLKYFFGFLLSVSIVACSHLVPQQGQGTQEPTPVPDCRKNYTKEFSLSSDTAYKTWVKYDDLDYNRAFDAAVFSIQNNGYSVTSTDRGSGTVHGQMASGSGQQIPYPIAVQIAKENTSLILNLSFKATGEAKDQARLCGFYEEFEKLVKQVPTASPPKETPQPTPGPIQSPPIKVQETVKPVTPTVEAKPKPAPSPPPSRITEVAWTSVNLREGPGMNYRVIGSAKKGTSLRVFEDKGGWLRVRLEDGKEVWVSKSATPEAPKTSSAPSPSPSPPSSPSSKRAPSKPVSPM